MRKKRAGCTTVSPVKKRVEEMLDLPCGMLSDMARVELSGNRRAVVEGCHGILEYEEGLIRLNTSSGVIRFVGQQLCLSCLTDDSAVVTGILLSVEFLS